MKIEGVIYQFAVKGRRSKDNWDGLYKQQTHLVYAWRKLKLTDEFDNEWAWTFSWPKEDGSGESRLGKGWKRVPVWEEYLGGVKQWIEDLHNRSVFPRHLDPFESVFPQSLPVERRADEVESWKRQVVAQELEINSAFDCAVPPPDHPDFGKWMDVNFPQYSHSCHAFGSGCQFIDVCWNGVPAEPGELYQLRTPNHPENNDIDEQE